MGCTADLITKISIEQITDSELKNLIPFVVPSQRVEAWSFPTSVTTTGIKTSQNIPLYHVTDLKLLFEATYEFEDALTTSRNTASRRLNPHIDLTSFMITLQCKRNSNDALTFDELDTQNQIPPPPIICAIHDIFWLFRYANGGSCVDDVNNTFDEVIRQIEG
ncbi:MAG: hypothetical protein EZS28_012250 [Streblomastix strix]|uniref:Uncharacterized protein n=1 Tax=Streblomastix strix TaxID=222440 RepID=A0A5J4WCZ6_9EUKA|nr:MAG: hypothetical protein EZS28_012250 [Streblomastix strix]